MTVKEIINRLTADNVRLDDEVFFIDTKSNIKKEYKITAVGIDEEKHRINLNNLY